jgi:hypothetical protein
MNAIKWTQKKIERFRTKRRLVRKGKEGFSEETIQRVATGIKRQMKLEHAKKPVTLDALQQIDLILKKSHDTKVRMITKNALDRMGLTDWEKRNLIHTLINRLGRRTAEVISSGGSTKKDSLSLSTALEIKKVLGGKKQYSKFAKCLREARESLK